MSLHRIGLDGESNDLLREQMTMRVKLWDLGPSKPVAPGKPKPPKGQDGDPDYELAKIEFREVLDQYADDLKRYAQAKKEYAQFLTQWGGPYEIEMWSVDARDALINHGENNQYGHPPRYYVKDRRLPNDGLPEGMKPGHGHRTQLERRAAGDAEFEEQRRKDPQFGAAAQGVAA